MYKILVISNIQILKRQNWGISGKQIKRMIDN